MHVVQPVEAHAAQTLIATFNQLFSDSENTWLIGGGEEPIYLPADDSDPRNRIIFTRDYFASAQHEVAHWCVAGPARRQLVDFGYWYVPDGRTPEQQHQFEQVEIQPQAMEWMFSMACGFRYRVSADNLQAGLGASEEFKVNIHAQVQDYCRDGLPDRADRYTRALAEVYGVVNPYDATLYCLEDL